VAELYSISKGDVDGTSVYLIIAGLRLLYFVCVIVQSIQDKAFGFTVCGCSPRMVASWWWWNIDRWRACPLLRIHQLPTEKENSAQILC